MEYYYIYLLGYLICYVILKELRNLENSNEWSDVKLTFILSLTSLVGVLVFVVVGVGLCPRVIFAKNSISRVCACDPRVGIVHRLDRETSGVILVAKTEEAFAFYQEQFKGREVKKIYQGIVWGSMKEDIGTINRPLGRSTKDFRMRVVGSQARGTLREAITKYRVLERANGFSFVEFYLLTGRTHQIRAHMRSAGYPLVSDSLYGMADKGEALGIQRVALHALSLHFTLLSGKEIDVKAPYPLDFVQALESMRKGNL
jgi:RluA family pseudouridine synthase